MEDNFNQSITIINILVSCFCSIFYLSRKYLHRGKQSKYTDQIINKINELGIGEFSISQIVDEIKKILPVKLDEEELKNINLEIQSENIDIKIE